MTKAAALLCLAWVFAAPAAAFAQAEPPPPPPSRELEDGSTEVAELVVIARRPGPDPSLAKTACLWAALPEDQRASLSRGAEEAVRTLAHHDDIPLKNPALTQAAILHGLTVCKASTAPDAIPFARVALLAFAAENATARALAASRIYEPKLDRAWASLTPREQDLLLAASTDINDGQGSEEEVDAGFVPAVFKLLRIVRPVGVFNPLSYRNGTTTHRVVYYFEGRSLRSAMERRF